MSYIIKSVFEIIFFSLNLVSMIKRKSYEFILSHPDISRPVVYLYLNFILFFIWSKFDNFSSQKKSYESLKGNLIIFINY